MEDTQAFFRACQAPTPERLAELLSRRPELVATWDGQPRCPRIGLMYAAHAGRVANVELLLAKAKARGADILNERTNGGATAVCSAPICVYVCLQEIFVTSDISLLFLAVTVSLYPVWRAQLWYAASVGKNDCVYALLEAGADPCLAQVTAQGVSRTPLDIARENNHVHVVTVLEVGFLCNPPPARNRGSLPCCVMTVVTDRLFLMSTTQNTGLGSCVLDMQGQVSSPICMYTQIDGVRS